LLGVSAWNSQLRMRSSLRTHQSFQFFLKKIVCEIGVIINKRKTCKCFF
jgi:hypothetical protein